MRKWILAVVAALCLLPAAAEAGVVRYTANPDPTTVDGYLTEAGNQLWGYYEGVAGGSAGWSGVNDGGTLAWRVSNAGYTSYSFYQLGVTTTDAAEGSTNGWVMTATIRMPQANQPSTAGDILVGYTYARNWYLIFGTDADGDPIVKTYDTGGGGGGGSYTIEGAGTGSYHTYELRYDPTNGRADVFVDGTERISNWLAGNLYPSTASPYFRWGDVGYDTVTGSQCYFNLTEWYSIPEPATVALMGLGLAAVFALRKKR